MADRRLTGILLVGGASRRFGSPKELAEHEGETLRERAWRLLGDACEERIAVGRAGLDAASHDLVVVVPVDMPLLTVAALHALADACRDAAVGPAGPLPCAIRRHAFPETDERRLRTVLAGLDTAVVDLEETVLANVNTPDDLEAL
jgi:molybdopterin-guanine dinucleotide biosynthesis protein A